MAVKGVPVRVRLTDDGANAIRGTAVAELGNLDMGSSMLEFDEGTCLIPSAGGALQVITPNPHIFYLSGWAYASTDQSLLTPERR